MSLEARIELLTSAIIELTSAIIELTAAIGGTQAPGPVDASAEIAELLHREREALTQKAFDDAQAVREEQETKKPEPSSDTTSGEPSQPTGESSSPELDYAKDVKPITIRLSKEKGREVTIGVLSRFGVKSAQDLDASQWAEYIAHCESVLAGGEV